MRKLEHWDEEREEEEMLEDSFREEEEPETMKEIKEDYEKLHEKVAQIQDFLLEG